MAKRSLSQNFLIDQNIIDKILRTAHLSKEDSILEIGPGQGALTKKIAEIAREFIAIETDGDLIPILQRIPKVKIIHADFLEFDLTPLKSMKVISNLPYHITSKILKKLVLHKPLFSSWTLMMQREFADKLLNPLSGPLIYFLNEHYTIKVGFHVSPHAFYPKPSIESTVVTFIANDKPLDIQLLDFLTYCFEHRRKVLHKTLSAHYPNIDLGLSPSVRIEELTKEDIAKLYQKTQGNH